MHFLGIGTQAVVSAGDNVVKVVKEDGGEVRRLPDTGAYMHTSDVTAGRQTGSRWWLRRHSTCLGT
ncbi:MAG: hypothetical protein CM1200mP29_05660 [Verrucomicrobiota bacterium]|nr:MAG: hypothetical protein CM1200mP29_05660 [Verrucomicrobiota bacterium]